MIRGHFSAITLPGIGYMANMSGNGKMSLPVAPSSYIYSHFKHVSGVPAPKGVQGVAINKLKILDDLIEALAKLKNQPAPAPTAGGTVSKERIDALIEQYEKQIRQTQAAAVAIPYHAAPAASGAVFSIAT